MSVDKRLFLGIKQVTNEFFSGLTDSEKIGYLWFVRCENPPHFKIFLGTRMYGETNEALDDIVGKIRDAVGLTSGFTLPDNFKYENIIDALNDYDIRIDELVELIESINSKIPDEASKTNQLADKEYVNNLIAKSSSYFRGSWKNWADVPTNSNEYPEDANGNRIPRLGDYLVIEDASDYNIESGLTGTWRFTYTGEWGTDGKNGWKKEYQINEEPEITVSFYLKREGDDDSDAILITECKIIKTNTLTSYPQLTYSEFKDGGYWDTDITELRNITEEKRVTYIVPIQIGNQLNELCYENGWCNSSSYMTIEEMENLTNK